jgi:hypothetical protein
MQMRIPRPDRSVLTLLGAAFVGAILASGGTQMASLWDRPPTCTETVMKALSTDHTVNGTFSCFDIDIQSGLQRHGVFSDSTFASELGHSGDYSFVQKTQDGGYVFEYDRLGSPHNRVTGALTALYRLNPRGAWMEITGQTQQATSIIYTFYVDRDGKISQVK